jgi:hypothetical protein
MFADWNKPKENSSLQTSSFKGYKEVPVSRRFLGFGSDIPMNTLQEMRKIIIESSENYPIIALAREIVRDCPAKDRKCELITIYNYVRDNTRYVMDTDKRESLQTPMMFLDAMAKGTLFQGDCDCLTILSLSLMKAIGYQTKLIAAGYGDEGLAGALMHVYGAVRANSNKQWIPVESIKLGVPLGWEAPTRTNKIELVV